MRSNEARRARHRRQPDPKFRRGWLAAALTAVAIAITGAMVACSEPVAGPSAQGYGEVPLEKQAPAIGPLTFANVGTYHNIFLDYSFPKVREALASGGGRAGACRAIAQAMREFVVLHKVDADPSGIGDDIAGTRCTDQSGRIPEPGSRLALAGDGTTSAEFNAVVAEMESAVEAGYSTEALSALFDQKVAYARANFPAEEADVIAAAASVGLSSVVYWNANYLTQLDLLAAAVLPKPYNRLPLNAAVAPEELSAAALAPPGEPRLWKAAAMRVGGADLKGAIHGGISGFRGGWQGILAGAVIEGGAKSAGALLRELLK